jgi:hypothetical protein
MKDVIYVSPMFETFHMMQHFVTEAAKNADQDILLGMWVELDYTCDSCRAMK